MFLQETTQEPVIVPAAIKLQPHDDDAPTFTPNCYEYDWLIAKVSGYKGRKKRPPLCLSAATITLVIL